MKRLTTILVVSILFSMPCHAWSWGQWDSDEYAIKKLLKSQIKYANANNFDNFIKTYDSAYVNSDGFNLETYSKLIRDIWNTYENIRYDIKIKDIAVKENKATVSLVELSDAEILMKPYDGILKSEANTVYYLEKKQGKWKVVSDEVLDEETLMLYGQAKSLDVKLTVPNKIEPNTEYCATLEFTPPAETMAIASIASDIVEYPQKPTEEVFRALPEDNILERLFISNSKNANEYIVASIGLTKTSVSDLSLKLSLTGFGYAIKRVNVINKKQEQNSDKN